MSIYYSTTALSIARKNKKLPLNDYFILYHLKVIFIHRLYLCYDVFLEFPYFLFLASKSLHHHNDVSILPLATRLFEAKNKKYGNSKCILLYDFRMANLFTVFSFFSSYSLKNVDKLSNALTSTGISSSERPFNIASVICL